LNKINKDLINRNINALKYTEEADIEHDVCGINALVKDISSQLKEVNYEKIREEEYDALFIDVFDKSFENLNSVSIGDLKRKSEFVKSQLAIKRNEEIQKKRNEYKNSESLFKRAEKMYTKLNQLEKIYKESLKDYQSRFIENIEILFHIYYGRIAQETKNSLGLFIQSDGGSIKFLEHHSQNTDVIFTMSSGQLATLVIAFTLALNKRFSKNKLLFIDDPVQTLDELNVAGLVELLRNEFNDQQIFLSTHEDSISTYIRYKFKKFGLQHERLSFKEAQFA
jgi:exonuclease SbcC